MQILFEFYESECEGHLALQDHEGMTAQQLATDIYMTLKSTKNDEEIQNALVDLLGYDDFDFIMALIAHRNEILKGIELSSDGAPFEDSRKRSADSAAPKVPQRPIYGAQVTVMSESEKIALKQTNQMKKKAMKKKGKMLLEESEHAAAASQFGMDGDHLRRVREEQLLAASNKPLFSEEHAQAYQKPEYPNVYQSGHGGSTLSLFGTRFALPVGTINQDFKDHQSISIPLSKKAPPRSTETVVEIQELDEWAQRAFRGYKSLNRVQSIVYPIAFGTNENMLVCAPTGAGKTDVAMLTVVRTLMQFREGNTLRKDDFKIVYIAPMKALAAEVVRKFSARLGGDERHGGLGITVKELTGDMQLTKAEIAATQMIVTTPEKWDVVTRKSVGDTELAQKVRLLIIDEVHLLHDDRGSVIESVVARTLRQVEASQSMIRIVGLSATLPNYVDVAQFLGVNPYQGLFYFDSGFRPVPLAQHFLGVKAKAGSNVSKMIMNNLTYDKVCDLLRQQHQVMVFVHSRKETVKTAQFLKDEASKEGQLGIFDPQYDEQYSFAAKEVNKSRNKELRELFPFGFGFHHAGMLRSDRTMTEKMFEKGLLRVLVCTATLAWGVNLPAYAVVIKGTQLYDAQKGGFVDLSILDVLQIFGRAGRPQYEDNGEAYIITTHDKLNHYVSAMTQQHPIESRFAENLKDNLNAEICLGTVTNLDEAVKWLSYTYLYVRMRKNPFQYGLDWKDVQDDPLLGKKRRDLLVTAAKILHRAQMIVFDETTGYLTAKDLGRTASNFYVRSLSIETFNELMRPRMTEADVFAMVSMSSEFDNIKVREEESTEMKFLEEEYCMCAVKGSIDTSYGKTNILLQSYISRGPINDFALVSDSAYVAQNAARILRALFQVAVGRSWGPTASVILSLCKSVDRRMWSFEHPIAQFDLPPEIVTKLDSSEKKMSIEQMRDMDPQELGQLVRHVKMGTTIMRCVEQFPTLLLDASIAPITRTVLRITLTITPDFLWNDRVHGSVEPWWIFVEDSEHIEILHSEYLLLSKRQADEPQKLGFSIPIPKTNSTVDELPPQIFVRAVSDKWIGAETILPVSFKHLILPNLYRTPHTNLLDLQPLPVSALQDPVLEEICRQRFEYFNPVQTQIFHTLYRTQHNALVGAPTGSGKTVAAELAMWGAFRDFPLSKVVYIAPLKALVKERVHDWKTRITPYMGRNLVELTGDVTPDMRTIQSADIIITTPEKWDGISRGWQTRGYVTSVSLVIIDEIHLLGGDRGPILEVIVSRMNYISAQMKRKIRIVGLSTALANAHDLADWLGIGSVGLFNFKHSVRPVPLEIYIDGYPGKHYCPRMISMNKPTYAAIITHSPKKPVIVFVSSRRQTRLTAQDLMALCAMDSDPRRFLHMAEEEMEALTTQVKDVALKTSLEFGIGLHHAGLVESDRRIVEELFVNNRIQVLIATSTLAWGVNYPAHLVVIKGTEYYDAKTKGYVDFPITDVLQMMGRAGRPQFDDSGVARILVHDVKKNFYKKFLHEPFPVESSLQTCLHDHINAEVGSGTINSKQDAVDYLTWTYLYRRLQMNPTYYGVEDPSEHGINVHLSTLIENVVEDLARSGCVDIGPDKLAVSPTVLGRIASFYYLQHRTIRSLRDRLTSDYIPNEEGTPEDGINREDGQFHMMLRILCDVQEYDELPVRHNEDIMNRDLEKKLPIPVFFKPQPNTFGVPENGLEILGFDDPHVKAFLLLQTHLSRAGSQLPISDYHTDTISVLDQSVRIMQAMVDVVADQGFWTTARGVMHLMQCIKQARWPRESPLLTLPRINEENIQLFESEVTLRKLVAMDDAQVRRVLNKLKLSQSHAQEIQQVLLGMPRHGGKCTIQNSSGQKVATTKIEISQKRDDRADSVKEAAEEWQLAVDQEYDMRIDIRRLRGRSAGAGADSKDGQYRVHSPRFPKPQYEGWWLVLADPEVDELMAMKKLSSTVGDGKGKRAESKSSTMGSTLRFTAPSDPGHYILEVHLVSDAYIGLDEVFPVHVNVE
ncbi:Sec63 Brl domain-containing protein [Cladochytrium replicatum]|nr:Sec63 Brl domain-containing protein [Cladochytrium replicatum]